MKRIYKVKTKMIREVAEIKGPYCKVFDPEVLKGIVKTNISSDFGNDKYIIITDIKNKIIGIKKIINAVDAITKAIQANAAGIVIVITVPYYTKLKERKCYKRWNEIPGFIEHSSIKYLCELFDIAWTDTVVLDNNNNCITLREV